jgi:energy-coupling factor transporter ATP-binding protein EcfA2
MSRSIQLTCIHALDWYGYQDSIPVRGNLLLAGVTGSGKSALMDLIQFVLIGDQRLLSLNKSATGDRSDRTIKGYCLGDTKEEENGTVQYMRDCVITYAALEFTWPKGKRRETWGLRVEFASTSEVHGRITPFFVPCGLERSEFLDSEKCALDLTTFKAEVEQRQGRVYNEGLDPYLRDMAQPPHLNFDRTVLRSLLPTAMSFTFLRSFNEFSRQFILPSDRLDVSNVAASYKSFLAYERDLRDLNDQFSRLKEISAMFEQLVALRRDRLVARYLEAELSHGHARDILTDAEIRLKNAKEVNAQEEKRLTELEHLIPETESQVEVVSASINATPDGKLYSYLKNRQDQLNRKIGDLKAVGSTLQTALAHRLQRATAWKEELKRLPLSFDPRLVESLEEAILAAQTDGVYKADKSFDRIAGAAQNAISAVSELARPQLGKLADARKKGSSLRGEIAALRIGRLPFPTRLLDTLIDRLPQRSATPVAQHLRELCEVLDERWRPAIEVAFTRKFAVVVSPEDYDSAESVYARMSFAELGDQGGRESLVNPAKALRLNGTVRSGSLAEKILTSHPVASAIVRHTFGNLMCVEDVPELRDHDLAILPNGFMSRGAFVERGRFYDGNPFVGTKGLQQQLAWKETELANVELNEQELAPIEAAIRSLQERWDERFGTPGTLYADLVRAKELPSLEEDVAAVREQLRTIDQSKFVTLAKQQAELQANLNSLRAEQRKLDQSPHRRDVQSLVSEMDSLRRQVESAKERFDRVQFGENISQWTERLDGLRNEMLTQYPAKDAAARKCGELFNEWNKDEGVRWEQLQAKRRELATRHSKFEELDASCADNSAYEKQFSKLKDSEIPEYAKKSKTERARWEGLFRTQVLEKLHSALREVLDQVQLLNSALKQHPIGNDRYQLRYWHNPDFRIYHDLIEANALAREDELFFASAEPQLRETIEQFLKILIEKPDSAESARLLDYRFYYEFDMEVIEADGRKTSVDRQSGKFSGGENQSPYFIAILASYLRAYRRYSSRKSDATLAIVPIDEAFSKLSGERIKDCMTALRAFDLQGVFSMSTGNIPYALEHCDWLVAVSKKEGRVGKRLRIKNIPLSIGTDSDDARRLIQF